MVKDGRSTFFLALGDSREELFHRFLAYLSRAELQIPGSLATEWRSTIDEVVAGLLDWADTFGGKGEPDLAEVEQFAGAFNLGSRLGQLFRQHGINLVTFLEHLKFLRQSFLDLNYDITSGISEIKKNQVVLQGFFDAVELAFSNGWLHTGMSKLQRELRQARYDLLHEKRRYFVVFQRMAEPAFVVDSSLAIVDVNQAFERFFGVDGQSQLGRNCCDLLGHEVCGTCPLEAAMQDKTSFSNIEVTVSVDNRDKVLLINGTFLGEFERNSAGILVILKDITEKKAFEHALRVSEIKYRSLVENVPDAVWRTDQSGRLFFISQNIEKICGYSPSEFMDKGLAGSPHIHPDDAKSVAQAFKKLFESGQKAEAGEDVERSFALRYRFRHRNGLWIWLYDRAGKVYESNGLLCADGVVSDITKLKLVEEELERHRSNLSEIVEAKTAELIASNQRLTEEIAEREKAEKELTQLALSLKRSNQELEQFAHVASHDLKEPLLLIVAFCEKLIKRNYLDLDDKGRQYLDRILYASRKLQQLIDDLLQLSRTSRSKQTFEHIDMQSLMIDLVGDLEERIKEVRAIIKIGDLPDLTADRVQVRQLFQNILANALKFRKQNSQPRVEVRSRILDNDICEIMVEDNGIGFDEKYLNRIFNPFERLHSQAEYEGTGIGLATCSTIVMRHGGEITARSKPGKGSVFIVRLPLYPGKK